MLLMALQPIVPIPHCARLSDYHCVRRDSVPKRMPARCAIPGSPHPREVCAQNLHPPGQVGLLTCSKVASFENREGGGNRMHYQMHGTCGAIPYWSNGGQNKTCTLLLIIRSIGPPLQLTPSRSSFPSPSDNLQRTAQAKNEISTLSSLVSSFPITKSRSFNSKHFQSGLVSHWEKVQDSCFTSQNPGQGPTLQHSRWCTTQRAFAHGCQELHNWQCWRLD